MKTFLYTIIYLASFALLFQFCTSTNPTVSKKSPTLATLGDSTLSVTEFVYAYEKSLIEGEKPYSENSLRQYLDLVINFKLKVLDAKGLGLNKSSQFRKEIKSYQDVITSNFLVHKPTLDSLHRQAYERLQKEVEVAHILLKIDAEADPEDTLKAYNKMKTIREEVINGKSFAEAAQQYSEDYETYKNGGSLGFVTALQQLYPFENQAYNTPVGEVSTIFRTKKGYHILKVKQKQNNRGITQIAHIMTKDSDASQAKEKIEKVYRALQNDSSWNKLVQKYSIDATSREKNGLLEPFAVGEVLPELEENAVKLKSTGSYSEPFQTDFGWHIIKLVSRRSIPPYVEIKDSLESIIKKDERYQLNQKNLVKVLKTAYNFEENEKVKAKALAKANPKILAGTWAYDSREEGLGEVIFTINDKSIKTKKSFTLADFYDFVYLKQVRKENLKNHKFLFEKYYDRFVEQSILDFEKEHLPLKNKNYALVLQEYREGNMVYELMNSKIWQKAIKDTNSVKKFFNKNRQNYKWSRRANADIYILRNEAVLRELKSYLTRGFYPTEAEKISSLYFDKNAHVLSEISMTIINELIALMKQNQDLKVEIVGHADPSEANILAQKRIDPVVRYLTFKKIGIDRIATKNVGNAKPVSKTDRSKNRRVEINLYTTDKKALEKLLNKDNPNNAEIIEGVFQKGSNDYLDKAIWKVGTQQFEEDGKTIYVDIKDFKEPRLKEYDEARGYAITDYQKYLEELWIEDLKKRYPVKINEEELQKLIKK